MVAQNLQKQQPLLLVLLLVMVYTELGRQVNWPACVITHDSKAVYSVIYSGYMGGPSHWRANSVESLGIDQQQQHYAFDSCVETHSFSPQGCEFVPSLYLVSA